MSILAVRCPYAEQALWLETNVLVCTAKSSKHRIYALAFSHQVGAFTREHPGIAWSTHWTSAFVGKWCFLVVQRKVPNTESTFWPSANMWLLLHSSISVVQTLDKRMVFSLCLWVSFLSDLLKRLQRLPKHANSGVGGLDWCLCPYLRTIPTDSLARVSSRVVCKMYDSKRS